MTVLLRNDTSKYKTPFLCRAASSFSNCILSFVIQNNLKNLLI